MSEQPLGTQDQATVSSAGERIERAIQGVEVHRPVTHIDERGELCEVLDGRWGLAGGQPLVYAYQCSVRPGKAKAWIVHHKQEDRIFGSLGFMRWVLYDGRAESPTHGVVQEVYLSERSRGLMVIPRGVWHAVQNLGSVDAFYLNLPTRPYQHDDPDKFRLPVDTDQIPYRFKW